MLNRSTLAEETTTGTEITSVESEKVGLIVCPNATGWLDEEILISMWFNDTMDMSKEAVCIVIPTHKALHRSMGHGWLKSIDKWRAQRPNPRSREV